MSSISIVACYPTPSLLMFSFLKLPVTEWNVSSFTLVMFYPKDGFMALLTRRGWVWWSAILAVAHWNVWSNLTRPPTVYFLKRGSVLSSSITSAYPPMQEAGSSFMHPSLFLPIHARHVPMYPICTSRFQSSLFQSFLLKSEANKVPPLLCRKGSKFPHSYWEPSKIWS